MSETTPPTASALPEPGTAGDAPVSPDPAPMVETAVVVAGETLPAEAPSPAVTQAPDAGITDSVPPATEGLAAEADDPLGEAVAADADAGTDASPAADDAAQPGLSPAQTAQRLAELFPALFGGEPKPIKLRIQADLQQRAPGVFQRRTLSWFLSRHTTTNAYLKALLQHSTRFDLDGQPAGEINPEHKQAAETELARRRAIAQAKRQAARAPQGTGGARPPRADRGTPPAKAAHASDAAADGAVPPEGTPAPAPAADRAAQPRRPRPDNRPEQRPDQRSDGRRRPRQDTRPPQAPRPAGRGDARGPGPGGQTGPAGGPRDQRPRPPRPGAPHGAAPGDRRGPRPGPAGHGAGPHPHHHGPRAHSAPADGASQPAPPQDPAQRERWQLLRAWEGSALSKANFCALKRLSEADFDAQIAMARAERSPGKAAG